MDGMSDIRMGEHIPIGQLYKDLTLHTYVWRRLTRGNWSQEDDSNKKNDLEARDSNDFNYLFGHDFNVKCNG